MSKRLLLSVCCLSVLLLIFCVGCSSNTTSSGKLLEVSSFDASTQAMMTDAMLNGTWELAGNNQASYEELGDKIKLQCTTVSTGLTGVWASYNNGLDVADGVLTMTNNGYQITLSTEGVSFGLVFSENGDAFAATKLDEIDSEAVGKVAFDAMLYQKVV